MTTTHVETRIHAPVDEVFRTVADIHNFATAVPEIVDVEFLSERRSGVGTRFRETREMGSRSASTVLEVTEYVENERVRLVSEAGGAVWDSVFRVRSDGDYTVLTLDMEARPKNLLARIVTPLMRGTVKGAIEKDMQAVKAYCEGASER